MKEKKLNCEDGSCEVPDGAPTSTVANHDSLKNKLIYIGDPMCSWCWGITNHLDQIKKEYADVLDFELVMGGLRPGGGEEWTDEFKSMIRSHWEHVESASGQPFDYRFFDREQFDYDTEPSARAVRVVRDLDASKEWKFYKRLQSAFYAENKDVHDLKTYELICNEQGLNYVTFESLFLSAGYKQLVYQDFARAQQMGVRGFPAVVMQKGDEYFAVSMGYSDYDRMKGTLESILAS
ncbi:MAG: DsbA family protein [Reichenbachiella sp.]|uniref:DsbA family protein n=1 Tax=Reichenbachiella sp. TaxID=2184521 RepID=UPI0032650BD6